MRATATFTVEGFVPIESAPDTAVPTNLPVGVAAIEKRFEGEVVGRSATLFTAAFEQATGVGTYVAMESFEGTLRGRAGAFNFAHSATTSGTDRAAEFFTIVPGSGTAELAGISGAGGLSVDADGTHRIWFDYELEPGPGTGGVHQAAAVGLRMYEAFNGRDLAALEEVLAPEFVSHPLGTTGVGAVAEAWSKMFETSPGIQVRVEDILVDGDRIAVRSVLSTPDSSEPVPMMEMFRVRQGRIAELWGLAGHHAAG